MKKQSLFLLFGGKLKNVSSDQFKEVKNIDIIGIYDNLVDASKNWKSISIKNIDNALLRYKVVPLNNILDPSPYPNLSLSPILASNFVYLLLHHHLHNLPPPSPTNVFSSTWSITTMIFHAG